MEKLFDIFLLTVTDLYHTCVIKIDIKTVILNVIFIFVNIHDISAKWNRIVVKRFVCTT